MTQPLPLSLYIHLPWCVKKCPYCDFNSHAAKGPLPEADYVSALLDELDQHTALLGGQNFASIFFGGGTPSLFSGDAIAEILSGIRSRGLLLADAEITLEANPGTVEIRHFTGYRAAGVNRLSLGIQSFQDEKLKILGRIHGRSEALHAIETAKTAGFENFNLDIMHGLPEQSVADALQDLEDAISCRPTHLSWYQLTLEPNTLFYNKPPILPNEDVLHEIQIRGEALLRENGFQQYEVSAWSRQDKQCRHNRNYWEFGDYLGIGAGAHSKLTLESKILRHAQVKHPKDWLNPQKRNAVLFQEVSESELPFEFMLNALRLTEGVPIAFFSARTGLSLDIIKPLLQKAHDQELLEPNPELLRPTPQGLRFLNDLTAIFMPVPCKNKS